MAIRSGPREPSKMEEDVSVMDVVNIQSVSSAQRLRFVFSLSRQFDVAGVMEKEHLGVVSVAILTTGGRILN